MATQEQINELILLVGPELLTNDQFGMVIDLNDGDMTLSAAQVWEIRAGKYHGLVNISESGSQRAMGDMYKNALEMARFYRGKKTDGVDDPEDPGTGRTTTRRIVRE